MFKSFDFRVNNILFKILLLVLIYNQGIPVIGEDVTNTRVYFSFSPGGQIRKENTFFAGETICTTIELSPKILASNVVNLDNSIEMFLEVSLSSLLNKNHRITTPQPMLVHSFSLNENSSFVNFWLGVPANFDAGDYELLIIIRNRRGEKLCEEKKMIVLQSNSSFGLRNIMFQHGILQPPSWGFGSNVYVAGETVKIVFEVGGLSINEKENTEADIIAKLTLQESGGEKVTFPLISMPLQKLTDRQSLTSQNLGSFSQMFILAQPGNYLLTVEVEDTFSQKKDTKELQLIILKPAFVQ
ncbi:MAG: hypothetical protein LBI18_06105 [Planctomycetaceae bacterium]|jgi:hypothetical protein|nr:hypothetical protein [Planctomycetaceae bacterium]